MFIRPFIFSLIGLIAASLFWVLSYVRNANKSRPHPFDDRRFGTRENHSDVHASRPHRMRPDDSHSNEGSDQPIATDRRTTNRVSRRGKYRDRHAATRGDHVAADTRGPDTPNSLPVRKPYADRARVYRITELQRFDLTTCAERCPTTDENVIDFITQVCEATASQSGSLLIMIYLDHAGELLDWSRDSGCLWLEVLASELVITNSITRST